MQQQMIITDDAESKLLAQLLEVRGERMQWHVVRLHGSRMKQGYQRIIRLRESQLGMIDLVQHAHSAYLCGDSDMFFLFYDASAEICAALREPLRQLMPFLDQLPVPLDELFTIHSLTRDYEAMLELVRVKKFAMLAQNQTRMQKERRVEDPGKQHYQWNVEMFAEAVHKRRDRLRQLALLVEDDSVVRQMASAVLRPHYSLLPAADGYAGLELFNHHAPDIVFLDIDMPNINGIRVLQTMMEGDPQAVVVMFTAHNSHDILKQALALGARGFVTKPFTAGALLQHARAAMGRRFPVADPYLTPPRDEVQYP